MIEIIRAEPGDAAFLKQIALAAKSHWGYSKDLIAQWGQTAIITPEAIEVDVVYKASNGESCMGWYRLVLQDHPVRTGIILEDLWVLPEFMGKGVGRALFEHAMAQAGDLGAPFVELDADPNARPFYEKMGCEQIGETLSEWGRQLPRMRYSLSTR
jgi:GNAT superfamily N-acetyltransferase